MKKEIFKTILFFIILFTLVYPIYATCTHEVGPSCSKENCGETWEHTSSQITREIPYHPFYETVTVCEESISIIGTECKVFESCQEGCTLCYFEPESLATMEWADSVNVYLLYNTYRDEFMNNLHKLTNLAVLKSYPAMLKDLMDTKYSIDFYIGDAEDLSITSDGHLLYKNVDFNLNGVINKPKIELLGDGGFNYNKNKIEGTTLFEQIAIDFYSSGMNAAIFENTFSLFIPSDETISVTGQGAKGLGVKGGNFKLNGNLEDGRNFDFSNSNAEELYVDFSSQSGFITGIPSLNIGGKDIIGTAGIKTQIYFDQDPPIFPNTNDPKIWVGKDGDARTQGIVNFNDVETSFSYQGKGNGVIAYYSKKTNEIKIDNPLGKKDVAVVTGIVNGNKEVEVIITMVDGNYKFEASAHDIAELSSDIKYDMQTLTIFIDDYKSIAETTDLGDIKFDIYEGNIKLNTVTLKSEESASGSETHTVESGDTLWRIAEELFGDGSLWTKLKIYDKDGKDITVDILKNPMLLDKGMIVSTGGIRGVSGTEILLPRETALPSISGIPYNGLNSNPNAGSITVEELAELMKYYSKNEIGNRKCNCGDKCDDYAASIVKHSVEKGIDPVLTFSIIMQESGCDETPPPGPNVGMMQIYKGSSDLLDYDKNIDAGTDILISKYDTYVDEDGKDFECNGKTVTYYEWEIAVRAYNGWSCSGGNLNYVEEVTVIYNDAKKK